MSDSDIERSWTISTPIPGGSGLYSVQYHGPERIYPPACESIEVVPAEQLRGAVEALRAARRCIIDYNPQDDAGFYDDPVQVVLDQIDAALGGQ